MTPLKSPYINRPVTEWASITKRLIDEFPLSSQALVDVVQAAWSDLFTSSIGQAKLVIGTDVYLPAQATGVLLERLIIYHLQRLDPKWSGGKNKAHKDVVFAEDERFSFEIKTSSSRSGLYGNRSNGHRAEARLKHRTGYYLVVNYKLPTEEDTRKWLWRIRFGWIDDEDWKGQSQPTGQQASVSRHVASLKLVTLFSSDGE